MIFEKQKKNIYENQIGNGKTGKHKLRKIKSSFHKFFFSVRKMEIFYGSVYVKDT
jgi:hypothetical protein